MGRVAHSYAYESGGPSAIAGVMPILAGEDGTFTWDDVEANAKGGDVHMAPTSLVMIENTHNGGGGIVFPQERVEEICEKAGFWGFKTHIDGARIFNASAASGVPAAELAAPADSLSFCLSKGLGCPVGSLLCGSAEFIDRARYYRELLGGGMRQAGIVAAAGIYALENHVERLSDDHDNARALARGVVELDGLRADLDKVQTNMVFVHLERDDMTAFDYAARLRERGVLVNPLARKMFRAVTHLHVTREDVTEAVAAFKAALAD